MRAALPSLLPHTPVLIAPRSAAVPPAAKPPGGCYYFEPLTLEDVEKVRGWGASHRMTSCVQEPCLNKIAPA
jgi:hypothetical protein